MFSSFLLVIFVERIIFLTLTKKYYPIINSFVGYNKYCRQMIPYIRYKWYYNSCIYKGHSILQEVHIFRDWYHFLIDLLFRIKFPFTKKSSIPPLLYEDDLFFINIFSPLPVSIYVVAAEKKVDVNCPSKRWVLLRLGDLT